MTFIRPTPPLYNLPSYYSECESYEEQLQWLLNRLQNLQTDVDSLKKDINAYTDEEIKKLYELLTKRIDELTNYINSELKDYIDTADARLESKIEDIQKEFSVKIENLKHYVDGEIYVVKTLLAEVENRLRKEIAEGDENTKDFARLQNEKTKLDLAEKVNALNNRIDSIAKEYPEVYNPTQGRRSDLQQTINDLYLYLRVHGIPCIVFDRLEIPVESFDKMKLLVRNFDIKGAEIFEIWEKETVFSPWTGAKITIKELCYQIAEKLNMNYKTASEFDARKITATQFDTAETTAYDFDWTQRILPIDVVPIDMLDKFLHTSELIYNNDIVTDAGGIVEITNEKNFEKFLLGYTDKNSNLCYLLCDISVGKLSFTDTDNNELTQVSREFSIVKTDTGYTLVTKNCKVYNADTKETTYAPNFLLIKKLYGVKSFNNLTEIGKE